MKKKYLLIVLVVLFVGSQLTRFENHMTVVSNGETLIAKLYDQSIGINSSGLSFNLLQVSLQKSMISENGMRKVRIRDAGVKGIFDFNAFALYFAGHDLLGTMLKGVYPGFKETFGDWSMDRYMSEKMNIFSGELPQKFEIDMVFVGRGYQRIFLAGPEGEVHIDIADGFLDNSIGMCDLKKCYSVSTYRDESIWLNVRRILNFFIEGAFISTVIALLITIIGKRGK